MPEPVVAEEVKQEIVTPVNPFSNDAWKTEPIVKAESTPDPVIEKKDADIKDDKPTSDKPNEPEKIPGATPKPIQDRPDETKVEPKQELPKFANEESEKVHNLLVAGKLDEVATILSEQKRLKEVDKLPPADIIKLNLQYQNKDFSPDDINDLFSERYAMPEQPVQGTDELDEDFNARTAKYEKEVQKTEARIKRDAKPATTELLKLQKEIVLPNIPQTKSDPVINEPTQEELDAQKKWAESFSQLVDEGLKNFKGYESTFKDEEVEIKVAYVPSEDERKELQPIITLAGTDAGAFMEKLGWIDAKGNINTAKISEDLPFILNKEKVLNKMVSETGNKRHEASIKAIKNIDYSGNGKSNGELGATPQQLQEKMATHFFSQ